MRSASIGLEVLRRPTPIPPRVQLTFLLLCVDTRMTTKDDRKDVFRQQYTVFLLWMISIVAFSTFSVSLQLKQYPDSGIHDWKPNTDADSGDASNKSCRHPPTDSLIGATKVRLPYCC